jgi:hypothetical protein
MRMFSLVGDGDIPGGVYLTVQGSQPCRQIRDAELPLDAGRCSIHCPSLSNDAFAVAGRPGRPSVLCTGKHHPEVSRMPPADQKTSTPCNEMAPPRAQTCLRKHLHPADQKASTPRTEMSKAQICPRKHLLPACQKAPTPCSEKRPVSRVERWPKKTNKKNTYSWRVKKLPRHAAKTFQTKARAVAKKKKKTLAPANMRQKAPSGTRMCPKEKRLAPDGEKAFDP